MVHVSRSRLGFIRHMGHGLQASCFFRLIMSWQGFTSPSGFIQSVAGVSGEAVAEVLERFCMIFMNPGAPSI